MNNVHFIPQLRKVIKIDAKRRTHLKKLHRFHFYCSHEPLVKSLRDSLGILEVSLEGFLPIEVKVIFYILIKMINFSEFSYLIKIMFTLNGQVLEMKVAQPYITGIANENLSSCKKSHRLQCSN